MTIHDRWAALITRLATLSGIGGIREADERRAAYSGDVVGRNARVEEAITRLESQVGELEAALGLKA